MTQEPSRLSDREIARIARRIDRPIVLVGLMGVGKSTVGRRLAQFIDGPFADADEEVERAADRTISEIFAEHGEQYFRDGERRVIARLMEQDFAVIATGGGAFVNEETRAAILGNGIAVWLDCDIETLVERTSRRDTRPLLRNRDPLAVLRELANQRNPLYAMAPIRVASNRTPHDATVNAILKALYP